MSSFLESCAKFGYKIFGNMVERYAGHFEALKIDLRKADMPLTLKEYLAASFLASFLAFIFSFVIIIPLLSLIFRNYPIFILIPFALSFSLTIGVMAFFIANTYPSLKAAERKRGIEMNLPFAVTYMSTIAGTGTPPDQIFRILAKFGEYGEVTKEAKNIVNDMDMFGLDFITALKRAAQRSPSETFKELLWGMITIITRGGDLRTYLHEQSRELMREHKRKLEKYAQTLSFYIEGYLTLVIVGSIFFLVMSAIFSAMPGMGMGGVGFMQVALIYLGLPLASIAFIFVLKTTSPV